MYGAPVREGWVTAVITAQIHRVVWACVDPILCRSTSLGAPPQAHEWMTSRIIGPTGLSWGLLSFWWTRGIFVPHRDHLDLMKGPCTPNMLHSSLCFLLLLLVGWFWAWTTCDWEHQLRGQRCYSLVVVRSHRHNCGSEFTGGGRQCWSLFSNAIYQEQSNTIVND
jgi:hypothetical protein